MRNDQKVDVFLPLFVGDYLASTSHLTATEHGAYLLLLMHQWKNGHLPAEEELLRRIARVEKDAWSSAYAVLSPFFQIADDGRPYRARLEREREICLSIRLRKSDRGRKAANARWQTPNNAHALRPHCPSKTDVLPDDATQTQTQTQTEDKSKNTLTDMPVGSSVKDAKKTPSPEEFIYGAYSRKEGHRAAIRQIELAVVRLQRGEGELQPMSKPDAQKFLYQRVRSYAQSPAGLNPDKSKIPHPKTWFGQSRYLDDATNWQIVLENSNGGINANQRPNRTKTDGNIDAARRAIVELTGIDPYSSGASAPSAYQLGNAQAICPEIIPPGSAGCEGRGWDDRNRATARG
jgi:uncharacterized protein YdaU (DUF1376 family)